MTVKSLTIELDVHEILDYSDIEKVNIGEVMTKYDFSIVQQSNNEKLLMVSNELLENDNIIIGFACFNLEEINQISDNLKRHHHLLSTVYIPSEERVEKRKQKAIEEQKRWGYRDGVSDEEIERNFKVFKATLLEIKDGLSNTSIKVQAV